MIRYSYGVLAAAGLAAASSPAAAQLTLGIDVNDFAYEFRDAAGERAFGGADHTGEMRWMMTVAAADEEPRIVNVRVGEEGPFGLLESVSLGTGLADIEARIELDSGRIRGGDITITLGTGDTYTADFSGGGLRALATGGFTIDGLTTNGDFSDDLFGTLDVSELNRIENLPGWALAFRFNPGAEATGTADGEVFVMVPLPPAALAGLGTLAGVMGIGAVRRRRMMA